MDKQLLLRTGGPACGYSISESRPPLSRSRRTTARHVQPRHDTAADMGLSKKRPPGSRSPGTVITTAGSNVQWTRRCEVSLSFRSRFPNCSRPLAAATPRRRQTAVGQAPPSRRPPWPRLWAAAAGEFRILPDCLRRRGRPLAGIPGLEGVREKVGTRDGQALDAEVGRVVVEPEILPDPAAIAVEALIGIGR